MFGTASLQISVVEGRNLRPRTEGGTEDPYVVLELGDKKAKTDAARGTKAVDGTLSPKWLKDFKLPLSPDATSLVVSVIYDSDAPFESEEPVGRAVIALSEIINLGTMVHWYRLKDLDRLDAGEICLVLRYIKPKEISGANGLSSSFSNGSLSHTRSLGAAAPTTSATSGPGSVLAKASAAAADGDGEESKKGGGPGNKLIALAGAIVAVILASVALKSNRARRPRFHEVNPGDTLCSIAGCYGVTVDEVYEHNVAVTDDPDRIFPGDRIYIPT